MPIRSVISSVGGYLPAHAMSNAELEDMVDTSDAWIEQRSGIKQRHIAAKGEATSDMAIAAAREALDDAGLTGADIDGVIVATTTPDLTFPSVAVMVQSALDIPVGPAFDIQAVCTGFVYALSVADNFIKAGQMKRVLVIGAEKMSSIVNWTDRTTCVLFGDGAGAVILEAQEQPEGVEGRGIHSTHLYADGRYKDILKTNGGPSATTQIVGYIEMEGKEVFKHAVTNMAEAVEEALRHNDISSADVDWLVPHQANRRIIESTAKKLGLSMEKVILTVDRHGNTSAASIPLALYDGVKSDRIQPGHMLLLEAMGGGLTWGSALLRF